MLGFGALWLQVLLVTVATFAASAIFWTVMPWHKGEFKALPDEDAVRKALHAQGVTEGQWRIPFSENEADCRQPEFMERFVKGPVGIIQLEKPGPFSLGPRLLKTFALYLVAAFLTAYLLRHCFAPGTEYLIVFRVAGAFAFGLHAFGQAQDAIWFSKSWKRVGLQAMDSVIYAMLTAGIFASMWPDAG